MLNIIIHPLAAEDESSGDDDDDEDRPNRKTDTDLEMKNGLPQIPDFKDQTLSARKEIIRKYVTGYYRKFHLLICWVGVMINVIRRIYK